MSVGLPFVVNSGNHEIWFSLHHFKDTMQHGLGGCASNRKNSPLLPVYLNPLLLNNPI